MCNNSERAQCPHGPYCEAFSVYADESECPKLKKQDAMCNKCIHKPVCGKHAATGGHVRECEHFKEERRGRWIAVPSSDMMTGKAYKCSECNKMRYGSYMPNYCQCCGADMRGTEDG